MARDKPQRGGISHQQVGRYRILGHIASGGMGAVYRAEDPTLGRIVALKVLSPEMAVKETMVRRFHREARAAAKLKHENIVQIFDFGEANGTFYLALEFVDGTDLQDYIEQRPGGRLEVEEAVGIVIQAAKALDHAHSQGIIHRDIKPSNFLVTTKAGRLLVKLTDLGLAREAGDEGRITRDNTTLGTVDYISPEQARDSGSADIRSDLYSLGCTFYHMLIGHSPYPQGTLVEKIQHHLFTAPPDIRDHRSDIPDQVARIVNLLLTKEPADRYQTPLHLLHDLQSPEAHSIYLEETQELERPVFEPQAHHPGRTLAQTICMPSKDLVETEPLLPDEIHMKDSLPEMKTEVSKSPVPAKEEEPSSIADLPIVEAPISMVRAMPLPTRRPGPTKPTPPPRRESAGSPKPTLPREKSERPGQPVSTTSTTASPGNKMEAAAKTPIKSKRPSPPNSETQVRLKRRNARPMWQRPALVGGIVGGLLFASFSLWALMMLFQKPSMDLKIQPGPPHLDPGPVAVLPQPKPPDDPKPPIVFPVKPVDLLPLDTPPDPPPTPTLSLMGPELPTLEPVFKSVLKSDIATLERENRGPHFAKVTIPADAPVIRVSRSQTPKQETVPSMADAWREAARLPTAIIEFHDRGPFYVATLPPLNKTNLVIRAAAGIRPLLIWDRAPKDNANAWMTLDQGHLFLKDVDLVARDIVPGDDPSACFLLLAGDFHAHDCTFTQQAGKAARGTSLVQLNARGNLSPRVFAKGEAIQPASIESAQLAHLQRCFLRGSGVLAVHANALSADVLFDQSLFVGSRQPFLLATGLAGDVAQTRWLRSTVIGGKSLVHYLPTPGQTVAPRLGLLALDSILAHQGSPDDESALLLLDDSVGTSGLSGKFLNTVLAGWATLVKGKATLITSLKEWRDLYRHRDGDIFVPQSWPLLQGSALDEISPLQCAVHGSPIAFAALESSAPLGCRVGLLVTEPPSWRFRSPEAAPMLALELPEAIAPPLEAGNDGLYHGEALDLAKITDLGEYLAAQKLAPRVVLHLNGKGTFTSSALRAKGTHLVLYSPPGTGPTLEFRTSGFGAPPGPLLDIEQGSLDLINLRIRLDWKKLGETPASVIRVQGGNLTMARCVVQTPLTRVPESFRTLIHLQNNSSDPASSFIVRDCVFLSGAAAFTFDGPALQVRCRHSLILSLDDAIIARPTLTETPSQFTALFDYNTFALEKSFLRMQCPDSWPTSAEPMLVRALANHFTSPTPGGNAHMLRLEGTGLARGAFAWHGKDNAFDLAGLRRFIAWSRDLPPPQPPQAWLDFWGHSGERDILTLELKTTAPKTFPYDQPTLERFVLPSTLRLELPGANMPPLLTLFNQPKKK